MPCGSSLPAMRCSRRRSRAASSDRSRARVRTPKPGAPRRAHPARARSARPACARQDQRRARRRAVRQRGDDQDARVERPVQAGPARPGPGRGARLRERSGDARRLVGPMTADPYARDPRVDEYIDALPGWQQDICRRVRDLVHAADPEVEETIKRRVQPYFVLQGNICALLAAKDHVNVFLYDGAIVPDPDGIITGGHGNTTARTVAIREGETLNARALRRMFEQIIANNRAGGWRRLKREG